MSKKLMLVFLWAIFVIKFVVSVEIYESFDSQYHCFRRMNLTHQIGCASEFVFVFCFYKYFHCLVVFFQAQVAEQITVLLVLLIFLIVPMIYNSSHIPDKMLLMLL